MSRTLPSTPRKQAETTRVLPAAALGLVGVAGWTAALWVPHLENWQLSCIHLAVFLLWTLAFSAVWRRTLLFPASLTWELGSCFLAAACAEAVQVWLPGHFMDWRGFLSSCAGVALAGCYLAVVRRRP